MKALLENPLSFGGEGHFTNRGGGQVIEVPIVLNWDPGPGMHLANNYDTLNLLYQYNNLISYILAFALLVKFIF